MKCKKEIKVRDPRLQVVRNNLREILWLEWDKRVCDIIDAKSVIWDSNKSVEEKNALHKELQLELEGLYVLIKPTIVMCGWCRKRDKDATYNPSNRQWFCLDCYNEHNEEILNSKSYIY